MSDQTDANDIVSPQNTEKLYGDKADQNEPRPGDAETFETTEPDNSELAESNLYSDATN